MKDGRERGLNLIICKGCKVDSLPREHRGYATALKLTICIIYLVLRFEFVEAAILINIGYN